MRGKDVLAVQGRLSKQIAATLPVNGVFDHHTREAVRSYQQARKNLTPDGIVGPKTWDSLFGTTTDAFTIGRQSTEPPWLAIARQELGVKEIDGDGSNPRIEEYFKTTSLGRRDDGVPWCAAFVSFCLTRSGNSSIPSARAADWLKWGEWSPQPRVGCVVVLEPMEEGSSGHVGFYVGETNGDVQVLGGNQSNQVKISHYPKSKVHAKGYRWMEIRSDTLVHGS
jgi:uncharacterized protein (TIGR02594 family)